MGENTMRRIGGSGPVRKIASLVFAAALLPLAFTGCAGTPGLSFPSSRPASPAGPAPTASQAPESVRPLGDYVAVIAAAGDTPESLAAAHLGDPARAWEVREFNDIDTVQAGDGIIIPLRPFRPGGLSTGSYQTIPILSYHKLSESHSDAMTVTTDSFRSQMQFLKENGYHVVTLDELYDFLDFKTDLPGKSVVITFDDGWRSLYEIGLPILKEYGYPATLFISTSMITGSSKTLSWDQVREMADAGIDMQCHTVDHRNLSTLKEGEPFRDYYEDLERELVRSTRAIEKKTGRKVSYLAYPYGATNHLVIALLKKVGYRGALTVKRGPTPFFASNYRVRRSMIYGDFDLRRFEKNLSTSASEALK
jgi:peptidoglycan/xylan/chitin deacetylase (PgdA/CDA1 family)